MAQNDQTDNSGWKFRSASDSSSSGGDRDQAEAGRNPVGEALSWFQNNQRLLLGFSSFVLVFFVLLVFASGQSNRPTYDIPGGDIERIQEKKLTEWFQVTEQLVERREALEQSMNPGGTLFTYYTALGERVELQSAITEICEDELISFEEYRSLTHEIALASPLQNLQSNRKRRQLTSEEGTGSMTEDSKQARIRHNLRLLSEHYDRFQRVWDDLNQGTERPGTG